MPDIPKYYRSTFTWEGKRYERKSQKSQRDADRKADAPPARARRGKRVWQYDGESLGAGMA